MIPRRKRGVKLDIFLIVWYPFLNQGQGHIDNQMPRRQSFMIDVYAVSQKLHMRARNSQRRKKMAPPGGNFISRTANWLVTQAPDWLGDALMGSLLLWFTGRARQGSGRDAPLVDVRGQVLADLLPRADYSTIWSRLEIAGRQRTENYMVSMLGKVPQGLRKDVYPALNAMSDEDFEQALELLHHDAVVQFCQRVALLASPTFQSAVVRAREAIEWGRRRSDEINHWMERVARETTAPPMRQAVRKGCSVALLGLLGIPTLLGCLLLMFLGVIDISKKGKWALVLLIGVGSLFFIIRALFRRHRSRRAIVFPPPVI